MPTFKIEESIFLHKWNKKAKDTNRTETEVGGRATWKIEKKYGWNAESTNHNGRLGKKIMEKNWLNAPKI